jgi:8-oxo-dGTP diphosphatase
MRGPTGKGPSILAAGGVVTRRKGTKRQFLVVHRPRYDDWSLPKGKLDPDEGFSAAAAREIKEETGSDVERLAKLGSVAYQSSGRNPKLVRYWLFEHVGGSFSPNREVDEARWLAAPEADHLLTYPRDRKVFQWAATLADSPRAGRIHLVRHAKAGDRDSWKKKDRSRPLTKAGRRQAYRISAALTATPVSLILSSRYLRCEQTVAPLARALNVKISGEPSLTEGAAAKALSRLLESLEGKSVVMCSHGAEIEAFLDFAAASGAYVQQRPPTAKGGRWELDLTAGRVTAGRYDEPPA